MIYEIDYRDEDGATSAIDTVEAEPGYTAEQYIKDCDENADEEWCKMLHEGEVFVRKV